MEQIKSKKTQVSIGSIPFMASILFISGAMNGYSQNNFGVTAGAHTGDLTKLSINTVMGKWADAKTALFMILACVAGVFVAEFLKHFYKGEGDWRKAALLILGAAMGSLALIDEDANVLSICCLCSVFCGFMLDLFRESSVGSVNSTIQTGNIRTVGQYLYDAFSSKEKASWLKFLKFLSLVISYFAGACAVTALGLWNGKDAILLPALGCVILSIIIQYSE